METRNEQDNEIAVSNLLRNIPHVTPPGDFDTRVRARIASGKPTSQGWSWRPMFAGAMSLSLLLSVGGYFALRTVEPERQIAVNVPQTVANTAPVEFQSNTITANPSIAVGQDKIIVKAPALDNRMVAQERPSNNKPTSGSVDSAVTESVPKYPRGLGPSTRNGVRPKEFEASVQMTAKSILDQLGVDAEYTSAGWKVSEVKANSAAERVGIKAGDVVESINDRAVTEKTTFKGNFSGKNMRVTREGKKVDVDLSKP